MGGRVENRRIAVGVGERLGDRPLGEPADLVENAAGGLLVHVGVRFRAEQFLPVQDLEEVELDVPEVALEVPHCHSPVPSLGAFGS